MTWFRRLSLRGRLMLIGLVGVGTALLVGGFAFFGALTWRSTVPSTTRRLARPRRSPRW